MSYIDDSRSGAKALKITSSNSNSYIYLDKEVTRATIQVELRYDRSLWDKQSNSHY